MVEFKVGDKVRRINKNCGGFSIGILGIVSALRSQGTCVLLEEKGEWEYNISNLELVKTALVPHIHQKEIIAWVYGAEIEYEFYKDYWVPCPSDPKWLRHVKYRVKPAKTPTQIAIGEKEIELVELKQQDLVERGIAEVLKYTN